MISRNTCTYRIHLRNETTMCHCSHYNIASSFFEGELAKPEIVVAAVGSSESLVMTDLPYKENVILMWESELTLPCHEA